MAEPGRVQWQHGSKCAIFIGTPELGLIGDIDATYLRFAVVSSISAASATRVYNTNDHRSLFEVIETYLKDEGREIQPRKAVLAVAAPIYGDTVSLTNPPKVRATLQGVNFAAANRAATLGSFVWSLVAASPTRISADIQHRSKGHV
jgi:hypothetical protein